MTEQEAQEFFEKVKGKKVHWVGENSGWEDGDYIIPVKLLDSRGFEAKVFMKSHPQWRKVAWNIKEGFNKAMSGCRWALLDEQEDSVKSEIKTEKCTCDLSLLMTRGCQCGGK